MITPSPSENLALVQQLSDLVGEVDAHGWLHADRQQVTDEVRGACRELREELIRDRPAEARVVCIGRTKAGKSTLRYALTGDGKEGIGRGDQRTTRSIVAYRWAGLELVDTPGVGAHGGDDDTSVAMGAAASADLVLWVAGSDSQQPATVAPILRAVAPGVPVVVLVNHKQVFTDAELAAGLSSEVVIIDQAGQEARLRTVLARAGVSRPVVGHVNLWLASRARERGDEDLLAQSGLPAAEAVLALTGAAALRNRAHTSAAVLRSRFRTAVDRTRAAAAAIRESATDLARERDELQQAIGTARERYNDTVLRRTVAAFVGANVRLYSALDYAVAKEHRSEAEKHLRAEVVDALSKARAALAVETEAALGSAVRQLPDWLGLDPAPGPPQLATTSVTHLDLQGDPLNARGANWVSRGAKLAVALAATVVTDGVAAPLLVAAVGSGAVGGARAGLARTLKQEQALRQKSVDAAAATYRAAFADARQSAEGQALAHWWTVGKSLVAATRSQAARVESCALLAAQLYRLAGELQAQANVDGEQS